MLPGSKKAGTEGQPSKGPTTLHKDLATGRAARGAKPAQLAIVSESNAVLTADPIRHARGDIAASPYMWIGLPVTAIAASLSASEWVGWAWQV